MSKSIKFKNNIYIDTSAITHRRYPLNKMLDGMLGCRNIGYYGKESGNDIPFDLDNLNVGETCAWDYTHSGKNVPIKGGRCYCICHYHTSKYQIVISVNDSYIYVRNWWNNKWTAWRKI